MVRLAVSVLLAALCGTVFGASPAAAHDQLTGTEPRVNQIVAAMPKVVRLTFSGSPMAIGTTVLVVDAKGGRVGSARATVKGNIVSLELPSAPTDAWYQVRWRVVSADGHLLSGSFDFGVGDPSSAPKPGLTASVEDQPSSGPGPEGRTWDDRSIPPWGVAVIGAALALATWRLAEAILRRRATSRTKVPAHQGVHHE